MPAHKVNKKATEFFLFVALLLILLLTSININNYLSPKKVLGSSIENIQEENFWGNFLIKNPNYIPGWIEIGRLDKAREIDPNFKLDTGY